MRGHMHLTAPLIIACSALLLCIGVIVGLTGSLIMQASNPGRSAPPVTPASVTPVDARSATAPAPALGNALFQADIPTDLMTTIPPAANPAVPAPAQTPPQQPAAVAIVPPTAPVPAVEASQPPNEPVPSAQTSQPPAPAAPAAYISQRPAAPLQPAPPMVGAVTSAAEAQGNEVDPTTFQQDLQPMGQWVATPDYGDCWVPQGVAVGWRPYTAGRWVYTECGWTWLSEEPWGHITYHYGSWVDYPSHGWIWVPGRTWAPAWVAWRVGGGYVGWAPLPPAACRRDIPIAYAVVMRIPTPYFCFVGERDFCDEHIGRHMRPIQQNVTIIVQTRNSTRIEFSRTTVVNRSLTVVQVEQMTGRRPREVRLERSDNNDDAAQRRGRGEPVAYRPRPQPRNERLNPPITTLPGLPKPPFSLPTPPLPPLPGIQTTRVRPGDPKLPKPPGITLPGLPTPPIPVPTPPVRVPRMPGMQPGDPTPGRKPVPAPPVIVPPGLPTPPIPAPVPPVRVARPPAMQPGDPTPGRKPVPAATPPIRTPRPPVMQPGDPTPARPVPQPTPGGEKRTSLLSDPTKLPPPPQRPGAQNKPAPTPPPAVRPAGPSPRPADPQPTPRPTRDRRITDTPSVNNPSSPSAIRPADPPHRRPDPTPTPEKRRERATQQASPPTALPADPAPTRQERRARPQPSEAPQRRQPAPADNTTDEQTTPQGQDPDNSGRGGGTRRGGR